MAFQHFINLPEEKQEQIIDAAMGEFIAHGYDLASTNRIVEAAGISKGALFKYFSNKEALFLYLFERAAQIALDASGMDDLAQLPDDFFEALKVIAWKEFVMYQEHPQVYAFFRMAAGHMEHPVMQRAFAQVTNSTDALYMQVVTEKLLPHLRPGISASHALEMMHVYLQHIKLKMSALAPKEWDDEQHAAFKDEVMRELDVAFELIQYGIYQRGQE